MKINILVSPVNMSFRSLQNNVIFNLFVENVSVELLSC